MQQKRQTGTLRCSVTPWPVAPRVPNETLSSMKIRTLYLCFSSTCKHQQHTTVALTLSCFLLWSQHSIQAFTSDYFQDFNFMKLKTKKHWLQILRGRVRRTQPLLVLENWSVFATSQWRLHDPIFIHLGIIPPCDRWTDRRLCRGYYVLSICDVVCKNNWLRMNIMKAASKVILVLHGLVGQHWFQFI